MSVVRSLPQSQTELVRRGRSLLTLHCKASTHASYIHFHPSRAIGANLLPRQPTLIEGWSQQFGKRKCCFLNLTSWLNWQQIVLGALDNQHPMLKPTRVNPTSLSAAMGTFSSEGTLLQVYQFLDLYHLLQSFSWSPIVSWQWLQLSVEFDAGMMMNMWCVQLLLELLCGTNLCIICGRILVQPSIRQLMMCVIRPTGVGVTIQAYWVWHVDMTMC